MSETQAPAPFTCPAVEIDNSILFKPNEDSPDTMWQLAKIIKVKRNASNGSVTIDAIIFGVHGDLRKADLRHVGDPSLKQYPPRGDSGVFKLSPTQLQLNEIPTLIRRMDSLEQTFRAVMGGQQEEGNTTGVPSASNVSSPSGRRGGRQGAGE